MDNENTDGEGPIRETTVTTSDDDAVEISVSREVAESANIGAGESVSIEADPVADALIVRSRPICEWCGVRIDETGETCPARDDGVACDPNPEVWYDDVLGDE